MQVSSDTNLDKTSTCLTRRMISTWIKLFGLILPSEPPPPNSLELCGGIGKKLNIHLSERLRPEECESRLFTIYTVDPSFQTSLVTSL